MQPWVILCFAFPTILIPIWFVRRTKVQESKPAPVPYMLTPDMQVRLRRQATAYRRRARKRPERVDWQTEGF